MAPGALAHFGIGFVDQQRVRARARLPHRGRGDGGPARRGGRDSLAEGVAAPRAPDLAVRRAADGLPRSRVSTGGQAASRSAPALPGAVERVEPGQARPRLRRARRSAPPPPRWPGRGDRRPAAAPPASGTPRSPAGSWSRRPCPVSASVCSVQLPIPGIRRSRAPASLVVADPRGPPGRTATSRAARPSASARPSVRSNDCSRAGACAAMTAAGGESAQPGVRAAAAERARRSAAGSPPPARTRSAARRSPTRAPRTESGRPGHAEPRVGADARGRSAGRSGTARRTAAGPGRCPARRASAVSPTRPPRRVSARAPNRTRSGPHLGHADGDRLIPAVQQPVQHAAADAGDPVQSGPSRQAERPPGTNLEPDLEGVAVAHSPGFAIR